MKKCFFKETFLSTVWQYILFKIIFALYTQIYIISHSYTTTVRDATILYIVIPVFSGIVCCRIMGRRHFKIQKSNVKSKASRQRFAYRMLAVTCFILIGYGLEKIHVENPEFAVQLLETIGLNNSFVFEFIFRFPTYILVAIFPISYALTEFLFSPVIQEQNLS